jgi:hypothetical protein
VHNGFLQKRKYKKGYHLSLKKKTEKKEVEKKEELVLVETKFKDIIEQDTVQIDSEIDVEAKNETLSASLKKDELIEVRSVLEKVINELNLKEGSRVVVNDSESEVKKSIFSLKKKRYDKTSTVYTIAGLLFTIGLILLIVGGVLFGVGFLSWLLGGADVLIYIGSFMVSLGLISLVVSSVLAVGKALEKPVVNASKKIQKGKEKRQKEFNDLPESEKNLILVKAEKRTRILSNVFTWATIFFPFFIIPAVIFNILVIKQNKDNKKRKNRAIWRLVALPFLAFIGLAIFLGILESAGVITSTAA